MDRATVYTQQQGRSTDFLFAQRATMIGLGKLAQAVLGSGTLVRGLGVTANSPAALNVIVGIGEIYSLTAVDATQWGILAADAADLIVKQGLNMAAQTLATPAPTTGGFSINYLIEAIYQDQDNVPVVLPYYNSNNPSQPLTGQNNSGAAQPTERQGMCVLQVKAGAAAATGTQTTPAPDAGYTGLAIVTVAYGQTSVTSANISIYPGVPQITSALQMMQTGSMTYAVDSSTTVNQVTLAMTPPIQAYSDGEPIRFQAANSNTGAVVLNAGPGGIALTGGVGALQGGELIAGRFYEAVYKSNTGTAVLIGQSGGAVQIAPATQSQHALQMQQKGYARFTTSGTLAVPVGVTRVVLNGVGGGGGGGSGGPFTSGNVGAGGGGGGAAQPMVDIVVTVVPGETLTVNIGAAGTGGLIAGAVAATSGGNTTVTGSTSGLLFTSTGGSGGAAGAGAASPAGGGLGGGGSPPGGWGQDTSAGNAGGQGGIGGSSIFGGGGPGGRGGTSGGVVGSNGGGFGSGGGGGGGFYNAGAGNGANGAAGAPGLLFAQW